MDIKSCRPQACLQKAVRRDENISRPEPKSAIRAALEELVFRHSRRELARLPTVQFPATPA
jgi:hypothetical protein